jgi:rhodanese-related sulfurtransferase
MAGMTSSDAASYFAAKLEHETDVSDVHDALESGEPGFVLIDSRSDAAWGQGHARGAVHVPRAEMARRIPREFDVGTAFVVYCWGPGCNGATRSALQLASLGYPVKEMIGGFEYWAREGLPVDSDAGDATRIPDPLTAPASPDGHILHCDC